MDIKELFLTEKESQHQGMIAVYTKIPHNHLDWCPAEGMLSLGQLARHVWRSEEGTRRIALEGDWSYYQARIPQGLFAFLGEVKSLEDELEEMRRVHRDTLRAVVTFRSSAGGKSARTPSFTRRGLSASCSSASSNTRFTTAPKWELICAS